jgi:hypothetical protein
MESLVWRFSGPEPDGHPDSDARPGLTKRECVPERGRCSHFSISPVTVDVPGLHRQMQVPIYRCSLAEVLVQRLRATSEGARLAASLHAEPLEGIPRLLGGPDLEAITTTTCTLPRCRESCQSGFIQILTDLNLDPALPQE